MSWATPEERRNLGQARRKQLGRQQNDQLNIKARKATPLSLLQRAERGRVPALLKLKHQLMARVALRILPGRGAGYGGRPRRGAEYRDRSATLR